MYGDNYGYRSGLNNSMVRHLHAKISRLESIAALNKSDIVLDIGSNDCTTLNSYSKYDLTKVGIDPTSTKFASFYPDDVIRVPDFFNKEVYFNCVEKPAKLITSIAMFYDLEDPVQFAKDIYDCLDDNGIWHFEQSYTINVESNLYDTICHEHIEYYSIHNIFNILSQAKLRILDISFNNINGGSFAVSAVKESSNFSTNSSLVVGI